MGGGRADIMAGCGQRLVRLSRTQGGTHILKASPISKRNPRRYWPPYATRSKRIENLQEVFAGLGFEECSDASFEPGYQKIALYEDHGAWQHASIQMPNGAWRSKMGEGPVIEHLNPESLSGGMYGSPTIYMRGPIDQAPTGTEKPTPTD